MERSEVYLNLTPVDLARFARKIEADIASAIGTKGLAEKAIDNLMDLAEELESLSELRKGERTMEALKVRLDGLDAVGFNWSTFETAGGLRVFSATFSGETARLLLEALKSLDA